MQLNSVEKLYVMTGYVLTKLLFLKQDTNYGRQCFEKAPIFDVGHKFLLVIPPLLAHCYYNNTSMLLKPFDALEQTAHADRTPCPLTIFLSYRASATGEGNQDICIPEGLWPVRKLHLEASFAMSHDKHTQPPLTHTRLGLQRLRPAAHQAKAAGLCVASSSQRGQQWAGLKGRLKTSH